MQTVNYTIFLVCLFLQELLYDGAELGVGRWHVEARGTRGEKTAPRNTE